MRKRRKLPAVFLAALLILSFSVVSNGVAGHDLFREIDKNADGIIDREELSEDMKKHAFERLDVDDNRVISKEEWQRIEYVQNREELGKIFKRIDRDRDRRITLFEFSDYADRHSNIYEAFIGLDKDGSNSLSPDEITVRPLFRMLIIKF